MLGLISPTGWVILGVTTAAVVVYYAAYGPEAVTEGVGQAWEAGLNGLKTLFARPRNREAQENSLRELLRNLNVY